MIRGLPADDAVSGIMLQLPLPGRLPSDSLIHLILPEKDIDGFTTASVGLLARGVDGFRSSTPSGRMALIDSTGVDSSGADALVVAADRAGLIGDARFGDVRFGDVRRTAGRITPVAGGVGLMTIAMLLQNTLPAARRPGSALIADC